MAKKKPVQKKTTPAWVWLAGSAALVAVVVLAVILLGGQSAGGIKPLPAEISVQEAYELQQAGAFLLDVREQVEWNEMHAPGATLVPLGTLGSRLSEVPKDVPVLVICRSGNRSAEGRDILKAAGYTQVTSVAGGIRAWSAAGLPTVTGP